MGRYEKSEMGWKKEGRDALKREHNKHGERLGAVLERLGKAEFSTKGEKNRIP
jgi:hypothetical protein